MTVVLHDAKDKLENELGVKLSREVACNDLVYADDTLLIDVAGQSVQHFMQCVGEVGAKCGLNFNWSKLEVLQVRSQEVVLKENGAAVTCKSAMKYLGSMLSADGRIDSELSRRLGAVAADFKALLQVWGHGNLTTKRKVNIFQACVESKLLYGLHAARLSAAERRRLDGFQASFAFTAFIFQSCT